LSKNKKARDITKKLKALASFPRVSMIKKMVNEGECKVGEMAKELMTDQPSMSYHMKELIDAGIAESVGLKKERSYRLREENFGNILLEITGFLLEKDQEYV